MERPWPPYRHHLRQLDADTFLTVGGIETTLIFADGFELPDFGAFTLLAHQAGRDALTRYFDSYAAIAARDRVGIVLEAATRRANADWGARLGYSIEQLELAERYRELRVLFPSLRVLGGCCGTAHRHIDAISRSCRSDAAIG